MISSTVLGMPAMPALEESAVTTGISFTSGHHSCPGEGADVAALAEAATVPLAVIVQVTKRCHFDCVFDSEAPQRPDADLQIALCSPCQAVITEPDGERRSFAGSFATSWTGGLRPTRRRRVRELTATRLTGFAGLEAQG
jgi:hypothetical protein